jgi:hypothetical protein
MRFVQVILGPVRFLNNRDGLESYRSSVNAILSFKGLHLTERGVFEFITAARTVGEAQQRADSLRSGAAQATNARRGVAFLQS